MMVLRILGALILINTRPLNSEMRLDWQNMTRDYKGFQITYVSANSLLGS